MALAGILFDLDGTLILSNDAHVEAWRRALNQHGYHVAPDRIALEVGKGGDQLVPDLLGAEAERHDGEALRKAHDHIYADLVMRSGIAVAPGAEQLLSALHARGIAIALATSSGEKQLALSERASGVVWRTLVDCVASADDVEASKPAPDLVQVTLGKLGLTAAQCAMVGDTPWDAQAAHSAGVVMLGLSTGKNSAALRRAGARRVYREPADLLSHLDEALRIASPGSAQLDAALLARLMRQALEAAEEGLVRGEVPMGSVLARGDGTIVARGHNRYNETGDKTRHAEMDAFSAGKLDPDARDTILVSTLEPCVMCTGAAMETAVDVIIYGLPAPADSGTRRVLPPESAETELPRVVGPVLAAQSRALFERWLERPDRNRTQEPYVRQLLRRTSQNSD
jgi:HAD superfamily hydrolase (TIGR01509 family)